VLHPIQGSISIPSSPPGGGKEPSTELPISSPDLSIPARRVWRRAEGYTHGPVNVKPWQPASESRQEPSQHRGQQNQAAINYERDARW